MKNFFSKQVLIVIYLLAIAFVACKKNQVCTCEATAIGYSETLNYTFTEKPSKAKEACETYEKNAEASIKNSGLQSVNVDCKLK